jgi:signal transduction histidine kinase
LVVLILFQTLPLALRSTAPLTSFLIVTVALNLNNSLGYQFLNIGTFVSLLAITNVAAITDNRRSGIAGVINIVSLTVFFTTTHTDFAAENVVTTFTIWIIAWLLGNALRLSRSRSLSAEIRAVAAEHSSEARSAEAVAEERSRIARELHDIIGHTLNLIVVQSGAAQAVLKTKPDQTMESLNSIETTARQSLSDMERMLGILRPSEADASAGRQPGLGEVDQLAVQFTDVGLPVAVTVAGEPYNLPASLDLSAYRIVQEALTNVLKHAGPARAKVAISYLSGKLELDIVDDGRGPGDDRHEEAGGRGLIGMRERVSLFRGELDLGPAEQGGFRVHVSLPIEGARS